jgi:hypothetical protein
MHGEKWKADRVLVGKREGKETTRKTRHRWEGIKTDLREIGCGGMDRINLAEGRDQWRPLVNTVMNVRIP